MVGDGDVVEVEGVVVVGEEGVVEDLGVVGVGVGVFEFDGVVLWIEGVGLVDDDVWDVVVEG